MPNLSAVNLRECSPYRSSNTQRTKDCLGKMSEHNVHHGNVGQSTIQYPRL
jgi:hypothetical protein